MKLIKVYDNESNESGWAFLNAKGQLILNNSFENYLINTHLIIDEHNVIQPKETYQLNRLLQQEEQQAELIKERQQLKKLNSYVGERVIQAGITGVVTGVNKDSKRLIIKLGNDTKEWNIPTTEHHLAQNSHISP